MYDKPTEPQRRRRARSAVGEQASLWHDRRFVRHDTRFSVPMGRNSVAKVLWTCVLQVQRKFRSDSVHVAPLETARIITVEMIPYCGQMSHGTRGRLACVRWGPRSGGRPVGLAGCRFLCAGKYIAPLTEHEWGGPQHLAHGGVTSPGILFMTWRAQGS